MWAHKTEKLKTYLELEWGNKYKVTLVKRKRVLAILKTIYRQQWEKDLSNEDNMRNTEHLRTNLNVRNISVYYKVSIVSH